MADDGMTDEDFIAQLRWEPDPSPAGNVYAMPGVEIAPPPPEALPSICMATLEGVEIPPREWIVPGWIPSKAVTLLAGGGGTGKSLFTQQLLACIAMGLPCLGMPASEPMPTLFINCEDEADELARRNRDIAALIGCQVRDFADVHTLSRAGEMGNDLGTFDDKRNFHLSSLFHRIEATAVAVGARVVALDNLGHLYTGNENVRGEVTQFANALHRLALRINGAVILLGHPAKVVGSEYSGSTGWENAVRARLFLSRPEAKDGQEIDPNVRILTSGKVNYSAKGEVVEMVWHQGAFVKPSDAPSERDRAPSTSAAAHNEIFLACLAECTEQQRAVSDSPYSRTYAPKVFEAMPAAKRVTKSELVFAMERLLSVGKIAVAQDLWLNPMNRRPVIGIARIG